MQSYTITAEGWGKYSALHKMLNPIQFRAPASVMTVITQILLKWNEDFRVN